MVIIIRMFDGHNDCLTQVDNITEYLNNIDVAVLAVFLSENKWKIDKIEEVCKLTENRNNLFIAIEDVSQLAHFFYFINLPLIFTQKNSQNSYIYII